MELRHPIAIQLIGEDIFRFLTCLDFIIRQVIAAAPQLSLHGMASLGYPVLALLCKSLVAELLRHALHHSQGGKVDAAHMRRHAEPLNPLKPFQQNPG